MTNEQLAADCLLAAKVLQRTGSFKTGQGILRDAAARICELEAALEAERAEHGICRTERHADAEAWAFQRARADRAEAAIARVEADLLPWANLGAAVMHRWPDLPVLDGFDLQIMAEAAGVLTSVPDGFDPEQHHDESGCAEPGDEWFIIRHLPKVLHPAPAPSAEVQALFDLIYSVDANARANASFIMNGEAACMMSQIKDADGRFLWADDTQKGMPPRLAGYPVIVSEDAPNIIFGDFSAMKGGAA